TDKARRGIRTETSGDARPHESYRDEISDEPGRGNTLAWNRWEYGDRRNDRVTKNGAEVLHAGAISPSGYLSVYGFNSLTLSNPFAAWTYSDRRKVHKKFHGFVRLGTAFRETRTLSFDRFVLWSRRVGPRIRSFILPSFLSRVRPAFQPITGSLVCR